MQEKWKSDKENNWYAKNMKERRKGISAWTETFILIIYKIKDGVLLEEKFSSMITFFIHDRVLNF